MTIRGDWEIRNRRTRLGVKQIVNDRVGRQAAKPDTFGAIVKEARRTRDSVYGLGYMGLNQYGKLAQMIMLAPKRPKQEDKRHAELTDEQLAERRERAEQLALIVEQIGEDKCEESDANIVNFLDPPVHMQIAPDSQNVVMCLLPAVE